MNELKILLKLEFTRFYGINKAKYSKSKQEKKKFGQTIGSLIFAGLLLLFVSILYGFVFIMSFHTQKTPYFAPSVMFAISSIFTLFTTIYSTNGVIFGFKDYDVLMSMPVRPTSVIIVKLIYVYVESLVVSALCILPVSIFYMVFEKFSFWILIRLLVGILLSPAIPVAIGVILGTVISLISSRFKKSNVIGTVLKLALLIAYMFACFTLGYAGEDLFLKIGDTFRKIYPVFNLYTYGVVLWRADLFWIYVFLSLDLIGIYVVVVSRLFFYVNTLIKTKKTSSNFVVKNVNVKNLRSSLLKREFKRLISSSNYFTNSCVGPIIMIIVSVILLYKSGSIFNLSIYTGEELDTMKNLLKLLQIATPLLGMIGAGMCTVTACSLSFEGKNLWIIKSMPVDIKEVFRAKIRLSDAITFISGFIVTIIVGIALKASVLDIIISIILCLGYAHFYSLFGFALNIRHPNYDWDNEIEVIKRGTPIMISMLLGMFAFIPLGAVALGVYALSALLGLNAKYLIWFVFAVLILAGNILLTKYVYGRGVKTFYKNS